MLPSKKTTWETWSATCPICWGTPMYIKLPLLAVASGDTTDERPHRLQSSGAYYCKSSGSPDTLGGTVAEPYLWWGPRLSSCAWWCCHSLAISLVRARGGPAPQVFAVPPGSLCLKHCSPCGRFCNREHPRHSPAALLPETSPLQRWFLCPHSCWARPAFVASQQRQPSVHLADLCSAHCVAVRSFLEWLGTPFLSLQVALMRKLFWTLQLTALSEEPRGSISFL